MESRRTKRSCSILSWRSFTLSVGNTCANRWDGVVVTATRTKEQTSALMRRVRSCDTEPEVRLRKALWRAGLRYRTSDECLPGKPDIVISSKRLAIFVDGDFWHGNQWRQRGFTSLEEQFSGTRNGDFWIQKIHRNANRDQKTTVELLNWV